MNSVNHQPARGPSPNGRQHKPGAHKPRRHSPGKAGKAGPRRLEPVEGVRLVGRHLAIARHAEADDQKRDPNPGQNAKYRV